MPFPGRRSRKVAKVGLVSCLILLTVLGSIGPQLPAILNALFPFSNVPASLTKNRNNTLPNSGPGAPLPPGLIQYGYRDSPTVNMALDSAQPPHLALTSDGYVYQTSFGEYDFSRASPFIFVLHSLSGAALTKGSFFFVTANVPFIPGLSSVLQSTDSRFQVGYDVTFQGSVVGHLVLTVDFQASIQPKFSVSFSKGSWTFGDFNIVWTTLPVASWMKGLNAKASEIPDNGVVQGPSAASRVEVGDSDDPSTWTNWLTTDWTDAPGASFALGHQSISGLTGLAGRGITVVFPTNKDTIDPTQVTTSNVNFATSYSTQRKVLYYAGKYYLFFYSGSNIIWKSSLDQVTWSTGFVAGGGTAWGGPIGYNFDIYQSGSNLGLVWLYFNSSAGGDGTTALYFKQGTITAGDIYWHTTVKVTSWTQPYSWPPSVAIGTDGSFWIGGIWQDSSSLYNIWIYRSTDGSTFTLSTNYYTSSSASRNDALQLVPLPQGRIMALTSHYYDTTIRWKVWNGASWSSIQSLNENLPANSPKWNLMSATATSDGNVHLLFEQYTTTYQIVYSFYNITSSQWSTVQNLYSCTNQCLYPTISSDAFGNLYAFWMALSGTAPTYLLYSTRSVGQAWSTSSQPFGSGTGITNANWLSAGRTASKEVLLTWTLNTTSPYAVYLGTIPLAAGVASGVPIRPWNKLGLSPYEQYFTQGGEYVSPGNGLLTVSQTDISVQGRNGLSLSIGRVYSQPFTVLQTSSLNYETNPYANLGNGWQINLPWVGSQNLHLPNGETVPLLWTSYNVTSNTYALENHQTEDFILTKAAGSFSLTMKDGTIYNFNTSGQLTSMVDRTGQNQISFSYSSGTLSSITDTVGRVASLSFTGGQLTSVSYGGQTVRYGYSGANLVTVTDAVGRVTTFKYQAQNSWLLSGIVNTAGGNSTYVYGSTKIGTDAVNYYVTLQTVYIPGQVVKSSSFSYNITDGEITNVSVKQSDGNTVQGYTNYLFNAQSSSAIRTVLNATLTQMLKDQFWFDPITGRSVQDDVYSGTSLARSFYNSRFYDLWGNVIYTRDNVGHESYSSFGNSNSQYMFQGLGSLSTSSSGKIFFDDFNGPSLNTTAWVQGASGVNIATSVANSQLRLTAASSTSGTWQSNWVRSAATYSFPFYAEVNMENWNGYGSATIAAEFILSPQATASNGNPFQNNDALRLVLNDGPSYHVETNVGGITTTVWSGSAGSMHSLVWKIELVDRNTLRVYLKEWASSTYQLVYSTTSLGLSTSFSPSYAYLSYGTTRTTINYATFDYVGLFSSDSITVNGLQAGQVVSLYDWNNIQQATGTVASGQTSLTLNATQMIFPYGYLQVTEVDGRSIQFTSLTREFWGGSTYSYTPPFRSGGLTRTTTGFLQYQAGHYVDEYLPTGAVTYSDGGDAWIWVGSFGVPVIGDEGLSGESVQASAVVSGTHEHYFNGSSTTLSATSGSYLNQYVYIPSTSTPSEIMLQFHTVGGNWEHRAYWGSNLITACGTAGATCGTNGTASRLFMGPLPSTSNSWVQLIVKTDDVGLAGLNINGWAYTLYNGAVYWDESELGAASGSLTFNNLLAGQKVELYNAQGVLKTSGTVATGQTSLTLNTYGVGINAFPFRGSIKAYATTGSLQYSSYLMTDIWGGDAYSYNQPIFSNSFSPGPIGSAIHNSPIGTAQYQNATSTAEEDYSNYDPVGNLLQDLLKHNGSPLTTTNTYDSYGNKLSSINPASEKSYFAYSTTYQHAYLTNTTKVLNSNTNVTTSNTYNFTTGMTLTTFNSLGNRTDFAFDPVTRPTMIQNSATSGTRTNMTFSFEDSRDSFGVKNEKANYTDFMFDGQNRITQVSAYKGALEASPILSQQNMTYNWQGQVSARQDPTGNVTTYSYDYLGRVTKVTNPDGTFRTTSYDGINLIQSNYDENGHRVDTLYNALGKVTGIREYYSVSAYYSTAYLYDGVSNLAKTTDPNGQITTNRYDDLNRLTLRIFPDGFNETRSYDNVGNMISKKDPNGKTLTYGFDAFNRLANVTYPDGSKCTYTYDKSNNILSQSYNGNSVSFAYDSRNRETSETWTISGSQYTLSYGYDGVGNIVSTTYPDGTVVKYSIDALNRIANVTSGGNTLATFTYTNIGKISKIVYGNGVTTAYTYDHLNRPTRIKITQGSSTLLDLNYTFDHVGNVASINTESYSYDFLNRLTTANGGWGTTQFGYDGVGNRLWLYQSPNNTTYTYGTYDRLTGVGSTTYTYDNNGNVKTQTTGSVTTSYNYDFENRLTSVSRGASTLGNYSYSPNGIRVQKIESGITTVYLNKGTNVLYEKQTSGGTTTNDFLFVGSQLLAKLSGSNTYYFHQDALGSTRIVTSGSTTTFSSNYQPFGPQSSTSGADPTYKYTQKPQDAATGLYYYGMRYYNTTLGRFISRDPAHPQTKDPQTQNPYSYARNNPETNTDPTGAYWISTWNEWGWNCVAWFWGWCTFAVPYWIIHISGGSSGIYFQAAAPIIGGFGSLQVWLEWLGGFNMDWFWAGLAVGLGLVAAAVVALYVYRATIWLGDVIASAIVGLGTFFAAGIVEQGTTDWGARLGFFLGLIAPLLAFAAILFGFNYYASIIQSAPSPGSDLEKWAIQLGIWGIGWLVWWVLGLYDSLDREAVGYAALAGVVGAFDKLILGR